ncbi:Hermansky-Pudlak syndrome 5 protein homolog [Manduca sexta]|uniref:Hermansky-Pudlak syndrome 5 protein homolog n=1 Tax=Manduca sexta TaxID=7130 RepID=UPI001890965D|nr:Hermansky-Pudlak syndrome 5 protein homolog [Manduca sexta]
MSSPIPPYMLLELPDITESINYPIKSVQRIKYTCFDVSRSLIAFGATSGGIYIFNRNPCEFVQLLPNKDGAITRLSISTDEKHVGFANGRGVVTVAECDQSLNAGHSTVTSKEHQGNEVTAMVWNNNMLFTGDDVGKIAVLQLQNFIAKTMFQVSSQTIMNLDSRVCQIDVKSCMLLVSTLTRCYICDTVQEQYRQIGQKLRDGEFGACFVNTESKQYTITNNNEKPFSEVKKYNMANDDIGFADGKDLENTLIFCARPSSRLWEATIEGTVRRTHQFKQILGRHATNVVSLELYENETFCIGDTTSSEEGQPVNFPRIICMNGAIFSFKRDALYFLNLENEDHTVWYDKYTDIIDCKVFHDIIYLWLSNGSLKSLRFMKIDKFLVKCYVDEKYLLCAELCAYFSDYLLSNALPSKLHVLVGLRDKIDKESISKIQEVLNKFSDLKHNDATQMKSGIYVVDNSYRAQSTLLDEDLDIKNNDDYKFGTLTPEAMQTLKDLSITVSDKISTSKKILKEKWEDFEGKMKTLGVEKPIIQDYNPPQNQRVIREENITEDAHVDFDNDIIYKESSQETIEVDSDSLANDNACKSLYQYFRLSLVGKETEESNLISMIESFACDIREVHELMLSLEKYCVSIGALEESKFIPSNIFLTYLNGTSKKGEFFDTIIQNEILYKYFVDSCISVNMKTQKLTNLGCECGYPLPYARSDYTPTFSALIDEFVERQWSSKTRDQCYDICKRMPYLWRKILYLRRNEDLLNILRLLLQMLDENLLHSFLPQFTLDIWSRAVQLYVTLHANMCLNCSKKFDHISVKDTLSWDDLGALMIKSIGGRNAIKVMEEHAHLIEAGAITVKFYHTCLLVTMLEKFDATITGQLTDTIYSSYNYPDSRDDICKILRSTMDGQIKNTALPISVAARSTNWGLIPVLDESVKSISDILDHLSVNNEGLTDCALCGLPLKNDVLIKDGGLWVFKCCHTFHGACLDLNKVRLCPSCAPIK